MLNREAVRSYIAEVCPVPLSPSFPLAVELTDFLSEHAHHFALDVRLADDDMPILRPFGKVLPLTNSYSAPFDRLETRFIPRLDDDEPAAILCLPIPPTPVPYPVT